MSRSTTLTALGTVAAAAALLAGCGSSASVSSGAATTTTSAPASPSSGSSPATTTTVTAPVATDQFASGAVPAVDGASNMEAAPTIHAGTGVAPTALTGADLVIGSGPVAASSSTVNIQYVGALYPTGAVFDSSWSRGQPATFPLAQVIPGFSRGITGMKVGGRRELVIPPDLGYGSQANQGIPANSTLVFVIDLLGVS